MRIIYKNQSAGLFWGEQYRGWSLKVLIEIIIGFITFHNSYNNSKNDKVQLDFTSYYFFHDIYIYKISN